MKTPVSELKKRSKKILSGNYNLAAGGILVMEGVMLAVYIFLVLVYLMLLLSFFNALSYSPDIYMGIVMVSFLVLLFVTVVQACLTIVLLNFGMYRMLFQMGSGQPFSFKDMIFAFTHRPYRFLGLFAIFYGAELVMSIPYFVVSYVSLVTGMTFMTVLQALMYLLLIIGSLIFHLYFGLAGILLAEQPEKTAVGCLRESCELMKGNKGRLFYMWLSFIGMLLLCVGSFGIGCLWVFPYMKETYIQFYLDIRPGRVSEEVPMGEYGRVQPNDRGCGNTGAH